MNTHSSTLPKQRQTSTFRPMSSFLLNPKSVNENSFGSIPQLVHEVLSSQGQPLDQTTREFMEPRFGRDFSNVRVHTDSSAADSADSVNATAFTAGRHIVFGRGQYAPETPQGRHVMAHELAHTLQQAVSPNSLGIQRIPKEPMGAPFEGEIIPWSAALRESPSHSGKVLADLPRKHALTVQGGRWWILVETVVDGKKLTGYVSHELIRQAAAPKGVEDTAEKAAEKNALDVINPSKETADAGIDLPAVPDVAAPTQKQAAPEPNKFAYESGLDPELQGRFNRMVIALDEKKIKHGGIDDVRPIPRAHILSTGYHIREMQAVSINDLQRLKDGKDLDGNTWYKTEWEQFSAIGGIESATNKEILEKINENALSLVIKEGEGYIGGGKINCAYEGYKAGDPHRQPNVFEVPISSHVTGQAIDLQGVEWDKLGGPWSDASKKFVASFGLTRPYSPEAKTYCIKEPWHFELAQGK